MGGPGGGRGGWAGRLVAAERQSRRSEVDRQREAELKLTPGRVAGLSVEVDPSVLRASPGARAYVLVNIEDRAGAPITDEEVGLEASEGTLGPLRARGDGTLIAEYIPEATERPREVEITAVAESMRSTARLQVAPRPVRLTVGAWAGVATNFGRVTAPIVSLDADLRVRNRIVGESLMLRMVYYQVFTPKREISGLL